MTSSKISYGPHSFPGGPLRYIRTGNQEITLSDAHNQIQQTLFAAFDPASPHSLIHTIAPELSDDKDFQINLDFINWGNIQLVYHVKLMGENRQKEVTALINQPHIPPHLIQQEYDNLQHLSQLQFQFVVKPYCFFQLNPPKEHAIYLTGYIENARCVFGGRGYPWGMFDPQPKYHFEAFSQNISSVIKSTMIALLVMYYDQEKQQGIAQTQLSGDDFILTQDFSPSDPSTILPNMKLIAARGFVKEPLENYIQRLQREFVIGTHYTDTDVITGTFKVNYKSGLPMTQNEINQGIQLGLTLRQKHLS